MRYVISHKGAHPVALSVRELQQREETLGLNTFESFEKLRRNIERSRDNLRALLLKLRSQGKRIVGYGATSKSTTVTNYCGITPDMVEFISDTYGMSDFHRILERIGQGSSTEAALRTTIHSDYGQLEGEVAKYLSRKYGE